MKLRFAPATDLTDTGADQSFTPDVVAPLNTTDFHTSNDEGHLHQELANLAAMARSIFHQVGATEVTHPELTTLDKTNLIARSLHFSALPLDLIVKFLDLGAACRPTLGLGGVVPIGVHMMC
jgi:hypothetical protein